jgi:adenylate kinase
MFAWALGIIVASVSCTTLAGEASTRGGEGPFVVMIGAPGSGKSINSVFISKKYGIPAIDVGKLLQIEIAEASKAQRGSGRPQNRQRRARNKRSAKINDAMEKLKAGELVSDESLNASIVGRLLKGDTRNGFVLDGYPGSAGQAEFLDALVAAMGVESLKVIYLDVSDEVALSRMKARGRADDKHGFAQERLKQFRARVSPILQYYENDDLYSIDASKDIATVQKEIASLLDGQ